MNSMHLKNQITYNCAIETTPTAIYRESVKSYQSNLKVAIPRRSNSTCKICQTSCCFLPRHDSSLPFIFTPSIKRLVKPYHAPCPKGAKDSKQEGNHLTYHLNQSNHHLTTLVVTQVDVLTPGNGTIVPFKSLSYFP